MMKRTLSAILCLLLCAALFAVPAHASEENLVTVNLYLDTDSEYPDVSIEVEKGEVYGQPAEPGRENKVFAGWYRDKSFTFPYNPTEGLYSDTDLYACFANSAAEVTGYNIFESPDAELPTVGGFLLKGVCMFTPASPLTEDGELMMGWYSNRELTNQVDFRQPVTVDYLSLFPKVVSEENVYWINLYFDPSDEYPIGSGCEEKGLPIPEPDDPGKTGFTFGGWYTDRSLTQPADFTVPRYEDVSLFPLWEEIHYHTLTEIPEVPATATTDGCQSYLLCESCGKRLYNMASALLEIENTESLVIPAAGPVILGDADGDGKVNVRDVTAIQRYLAGIDPNPFCRSAANVVQTDGLSINDATRLQNFLAEFFDSL